VKHPHSTRRLIAGSGYMAVVALLAALAAWPIYRSSAFVLLVVVAVVVGAAIAGTAQALRWPAWIVAAAIGGAVLLLGVPLAVPGRRGSPGDWPAGLAEVLRGAITAWKDLLTIPLPAGDYRNLLVPALLVFLIGVPTGLLLAWRRPPTSGLAVLIAIGMLAFGLLFGRTVVSAPLELAGISIAAPLETAIGATGLVASLIWLAWQSSDERARSLRRAATATGVRLTRRRGGSETRRLALGGAMILAAVTVGALVTPAIAQGVDRTVLRSGVGPDIALSRATSPLTLYRSNFDGDRVDRELFRVDDLEGSAQRVRIATLTHYDGEVYRVVDPAGPVGGGRFVRVPSALDAGPGERIRAGVQIADLEGIWLPTVGATASVDFEGGRSLALADSFYYSADLQAGVQVAGGGVAAGDGYVLDAVEPSPRSLAGVDGSASASAGVEAPESLREWVATHVEGTGGAALESLIALLRERGYLSHAVSIDPAAPPAWMSDLEGYVFHPSASGHSLARIDAMFRALLQREADADGGTLVAAIGDDEQFAVAAALIARELGFAARVVVGARLGPDADGLAVCEDGICRGSDIAVWTEVEASRGEWVALDVTPQSRVAPDADLTRQRDPENATEVRPETADEVVPPDPVQQDVASPEDTDDTGPLDLTVLWRVLRTIGIVVAALGLFAGPLIVILVAKVLRRRRRRHDADGARSIIGGWDEYVDAAVDRGLPAPAARTRSEQAVAYATPQATVLAERADRAVFAGAAVPESDVDEFWRIVEDERRALVRGRSLWQRARAAVSLRSFTQALASRNSDARPGAVRHHERRTRRPKGDTRST
jgi:hypothetical protein